MSDLLRRAGGSGAPPRVLIVGGGVAALEAVLALRAHAGMRVEIELVAPRRTLSYPPLDVLEPFGLAPPQLELADALAPLGVRQRRDAVDDVDAREHWVHTAGGAVLHYEALVLAIGARPAAPFPGALVYGAPRSREDFARLLATADRGPRASLAGQLLFVVPEGVSWPLPLYELAVMTARRLAAAPGAGRSAPRIAIATSERAPLELFGGRASGGLLEYLEQLGIAFLPVTRVEQVRPGEVLLAGGRTRRADRVVTVPLLHGPRIEGLPHDAGGFVPIDAHGAVRGVPDVYAAGDATDFPIKQGGLATQQADAIAETLAARAGAPLTPAPFRPVLRGMLLTSELPRYLESDVAGPSGARVAETPLWWPPTKVAGRHLAPFLAERFGARMPAPQPDERWLEGAIPCEVTLPVPAPAADPVARAS